MVKVPCGTETGAAPGESGATRENAACIRPKINAVLAVAALVEYSANLTTGF
jgi:hypothetical protein